MILRCTAKLTELLGGIMHRRGQIRRLELSEEGNPRNLEPPRRHLDGVGGLVA